MGKSHKIYNRFNCLFLVEKPSLLGDPLFVGPQKCDACKIFNHRNLQPTYWGKDLLSFTEYLLNLIKLTGEMRS
jgi:hypothetical protein